MYIKGLILKKKNSKNLGQLEAKGKEYEQLRFKMM